MIERAGAPPRELVFASACAYINEQEFMQAGWANDQDR
jgi:hypothetical protein